MAGCLKNNTEQSGVLIVHLADQTNQLTMGIFSQVAEYLFLKKKDPNAPKSQWVKYMHGINRISIFLFIIGLIILAIKLYRRH